ncbi:hypothetical protein CPC08DRAFT_674037, partial [Agrocybe pediades]
MRVQQGERDAAQFAQWLLDVGHGRNMVEESRVELPEHMTVPDPNSLIDAIYPAIDSELPPPPEYFTNR